MAIDVWFVVSEAWDEQPSLFGQNWVETAYTVWGADMLIKGEESCNIKPDWTFQKDDFPKAKPDSVAYRHIPL